MRRRALGHEIEESELLFEAQHALGLNRGRSSGVTAVCVRDPSRVHDRIPINEEPRGEFEILHLLPIVRKAASTKHFLPEAECGAHDEVACHHRAQARLTHDHHRVTDSRDVEPLYRIRGGESRHAIRVDDRCVAAQRDGPAMALRQLAHDLGVVRQQEIISVKQRDEGGVGAVDAAVPVVHHAEVGFVAAVFDPVVAVARDELRHARFDTPVVTDEESPV